MSAEVTFTLDDVVAKVREVAAENPDFVYTLPGFEEPNPSASCLYRHGINREEPGCIVGHALDRLGYVVPQEWEGTNAATLLEVQFDLLDSSPQTSWLRTVQRNQDDGQPWGEAVEAADSYVRLPALR